MATEYVVKATYLRWASRYVAYAATHGRSCEGMLAADRADWPGGSMTGFILWMDGAWKAWAASSGAHVPTRCPAQHAEFDGWLRGRAFASAEGRNGAVVSSRQTTRRTA